MFSVCSRRRRLIPAALVTLAFVTLPGARFLCGPVSANEPGDSVVKAYNRTGFDLFAKLAANPGNLVISPYSVGTAMAMTSVGARGETEKEMARVLNFDLSPAKVADSNQQLNAILTKRADDEDAKIEVANGLHVTGGPVSRSYEELLAEKFAAELFRGSDLATINAWVKQKTEGKIDSILAKLDPNSVCVILNAIYFNSSWSAQFDPKKTVPGHFHLSKSETVQVPMMHKRGSYRMLHAPTFDAIALPYKGEKLTMIILRPMQLAEPGRVAINISEQTAKDVIDGLAQAELHYVDLSMPKFKTEFSADLIPPFKELSLVLPFDMNRANFSGIAEGAKEGDLYVSQIQHKTFIDVSEAGTEAGASTAVEISTRSKAPSVEIDRPFLYLIADATSGTILFMGRMSDPRT